MKPAIRIGITAGDINGIGPEVALKALAQNRWSTSIHFILYGPAAILREQARRLKISPPEICDTTAGKIHWQPGQISVTAGREAIAAIRAVVEDSQSGVLHGIVTAPISKEGVHLAGLDVPGHTEFLAQLTGAKRYAMMLFGGPLRVVLATRHIPLAEVPKKLTPAVLREQIELTAEALPWLGAKKARVAVCGLNPHAGEGGDIGREEIKTIAPVIRALAKRGLNVTGPWPGDTIFHAAARGDFDAVVAMYHDQGLAPLKLIAFDTGVNVTLGLPLVRTSPDHGTAYAIAGKNRANPASMVQAIRTAIFLATRQNPWVAK